jgi:PAS domain S-box-containing protein
MSARLYPRLDWLVPAPLKGDKGTHRRARMFLISHLFGTPLGYLVVFYLYLLDPHPGVAFWTIFATITAFWLYPFALKLCGWFNLLAMLSVQQLSWLVLFTSYQYGGTSSPFLSWLLAAPISAYFYLGPQRRLRQFVLALLALDLLAFYLIYAAGYPFPDRVPLAAMSGIGVFSVFCAAVFVSMLSLNYANIVAAQQVDLEHEVGIRRATETALRESKDRAEHLGTSFRLLFDGNPIPMWVYDRKTLRFLEVNDAAIAQYGYTRAEFLVMAIDQIRPDEDAQRVRALALESFAPYERTGIWRHRKADGQLILVDVLWHRLEFQGREAAIVAAIDITDQKQAEDALRDNEARYRLLAENITDVITVLALDGTRTYLSPSVRDVLGYAPEELIGKRMEEMPHPDDRPLAAAAVAALTRGEPKVTVTLRSRHKDGHYVWMETSLRVMRDSASNRPTQVLGVSRDVSARQGLQDQLAAAKEQAERASHAKSEFLANMSHELRTPLNAIMGFGDLIENQRLGPLGNVKYAGYGRDIVESGRHLLDLINEILDFVKVDAGRLTLVEEPLEIRRVIDACVHMLEERTRRADLALDVEIGAGVGVVRGDEKRLKQVLLNLVTNSIKFTKPGGRIMIDAGIDPAGRLAISVSDTGIGIAPQDIANVLEPFGQVDSAFNRATEGTGLGLPLSKRLIEMHGGTLVIDSTPGIGTTATLTLPAERVLKQVA